MAVSYNTYYQTENYFGEPYLELIQFFKYQPKNRRVLDLGSGQGRNAIALARLGFEVVGIDHSEVGIEQMNQLGNTEKLSLTGFPADIYTYNNIPAFGYILLDSMFHFTKKDRNKELNFLKDTIHEMKKGAILMVCIQDSGQKVSILNHFLGEINQLKVIQNTAFTYTFVDQESKHTSVSDYQMIASEKE